MIESYIAYRASWDNVDKDWSNGWQTPITISNADTDSGYNLKYQLISQPVLDTDNDRFYISWSHWKDGTNGDTVSFAYLDNTNTPSSSVDVPSSLGTHSYAPTFDISYDSTQDLLYISYLESTTN